MRARAWSLRSYVALLLVVTMVTAMGIVGAVALVVRLPRIAQAGHEQVVRETQELVVRVELLLGALPSRLELLGQPLLFKDDEATSRALDHAVADGPAFRAIYLLTGQGEVVAAGLSGERRPARQALLGRDMSTEALFLAARSSGGLVWTDKYLSALSGVEAVGLAQPVAGGRFLLAEVPLAHLLRTVQVAAGLRESTIWLIDRSGAIVADTRDGQFVGMSSASQLPLVQAARSGTALPDEFTFDGHRYYPAVAHSGMLGWSFVGGIPAGIENWEIRRAFYLVMIGIAGPLIVGLLFAPFWASWLTRPLRGILERAERITEGKTMVGHWPQGPIAEFNYLSSDLEKMADTLQEREQKFLAVFNASPIPMAVSDNDPTFRLVDVNDAWCRDFHRRRADVVGRNAQEIGLWRSYDPTLARTMFDRVQRDGTTSGETWIVPTGKPAVLCRLYARRVRVGPSDIVIWAAIDITDMRRMDEKMRKLNADLENRVASRTEDLALSNAELSRVVDNLRDTQAELVQAAKMASLGGLVAGVAHELNTPLGNGLMAVTAMADQAREFRVRMRDGLRRSDLDAWLDSVQHGSDIAGRNLYRAAELVSNFKQVAVDQTSAQRRQFELSEVVNEMVISLRPTLRRTACTIVVDVPATGLRMDSYPGALGQAIGNLINNAVLHGFDGRPAGTIRITGGLNDDGTIQLEVADDGVGIAAELLGSVFDPFMTTKKGHGGTGLGLHITFNAVTHLMGGTLDVDSTPGKGSRFMLRLPRSAPRAMPEDSAP